MGTYKGNTGNLMQHWTLCEVLSAAQANGVRALNYIDAHAMAPLATVRTGSDPTFDRVCDSLPGQCSKYELAWRKLSPAGVDWYPNSANFVRQVWHGDYSLLLCEQDAGIADDIRRWLCDVKRVRRCKKAQCHLGDWRCKFERGLPQPAEDALTLLSFDPNKYDVAGTQRRGSFDLCPQDLDLIVEAICRIEGPILVQLSTYAMGGSNKNSQCEVVQSVEATLMKKGCFTRAAIVKASPKMMSLIYTRNVDWCCTLTELPERFTEWLKHFKP